MINPKDDSLKGLRLAAIDFGFKRVGLAVCDEFHITISPKKVLDYTADSFFDELIAFFDDERIGAVVIGIPLRNDDKESNVIKEIRKLSKKISDETKLIVFEQDESYSSKIAVKEMINIGSKKKRRSQKGRKDEVAAAVILREFLQEREGGFVL